MSKIYEIRVTNSNNDNDFSTEQIVTDDNTHAEDLLQEVMLAYTDHGEIKK